MAVLSAQSIRRLCLLDPYDNPRPMLNPFTEEERIKILDNRLDVSHGLGSASYTIRLAQDLDLFSHNFVLASTIEKFIMPNNVCAIVHDKSTWARIGIAVQNTFIDPGWIGFLTLEITDHANNRIVIPKGTGIAQIVFHKLDEETELPYKGKYQHQGEKPQEAL